MKVTITEIWDRIGTLVVGIYVVTLYQDGNFGVGWFLVVRTTPLIKVPGNTWYIPREKFNSN